MELAYRSKLGIRYPHLLSWMILDKSIGLCILHFSSGYYMAIGKISFELPHVNCLAQCLAHKCSINIHNCHCYSPLQHCNTFAIRFKNCVILLLHLLPWEVDHLLFFPNKKYRGEVIEVHAWLSQKDCKCASQKRLPGSWLLAHLSF